jgi:hypothetical protein
MISYIIQCLYTEAGQKPCWEELNDRDSLKEARLLLKEYLKTTGNTYKYRILRRKTIDKVVK